MWPVVCTCRVERFPDRRALHHRPRLAHRSRGGDGDDHRGARPRTGRMRALRPLWRDRRERRRRDRKRARRRSKPGSTGRACRTALPPGAARNALDCALWDLEAKRSGVPAHVSAGIDRLRPATTAYTISLEHAESMAEAAAGSRAPADPEDQARRAGRRPGAHPGGARGGAGRDPARRRQRGLDGAQSRGPSRGLRRGRLRPDRAAPAGGPRRAPGARRRGSCRSAPTRACTTGPASTAWSAATRRSTSSSTRPAG